MRWSQLCTDKNLQDIPYKIELDAQDNIIMSPASNRHGNLQTKIAFHLMITMQNGTVLTECSIGTTQGVKVADVAWVSAQFLARNRGKTPYPEAPELCVEIRSPSNTHQEMLEKRKLYFEKGAQEYWVCDEEGHIAFYDHSGEIIISTLFPQMPKEMTVEA